MIWNDCTNYSRNDKERIPTVFEVKFPSGLRITILKGHIYYKDKWVMHCFNVSIDTHPLNVETQKEAEIKALMIVKTKVKQWYDELKEV